MYVNGININALKFDQKQFFHDSKGYKGNFLL